MRALKKIALALLLVVPSFGYAAPVIYNGLDVGVGEGGLRPNSDAARLSFLVAANPIGPVNTIDLESLSTGYSANMALDSNVNASFAGNIDPAYSGILNTSSTILGYNTTPGGDNFLGFSPTFGWSSASLTLTFAEAISAFGFYYTGVEANVNGTINIAFNDGSLNTYSLSSAVGGGVGYFGFTDAGKYISAINFDEINAGGGSRDIWGIDDISYAVPTPATFLLMGMGLLGLAASSRKRNSNA